MQNQLLTDAGDLKQVISMDDFDRELNAENPASKDIVFIPEIPETPENEIKTEFKAEQPQPEAQANEQAQGEKPIDMDAVAAKMIVEIQDIVFPAAIALFFKFMYKKTINSNVLKLRKDEKSLIETQTEILLKTLNIKLDNPYVNYAMCLLAVYASKIPNIVEVPQQGEQVSKTQGKTAGKRGVPAGTKRGSYKKKTD